MGDLIFILCRQFLSSHLHPIGLIDIATIVVSHIIIICLLGAFVIIGLTVVSSKRFHDAWRSYVSECGLLQASD